MLWIAAAAALASAEPPPAPQSRVAVSQAQATVRILKAVRVQLGPAARPAEGGLVRDSTLREPDGSARLSRIVEFP